MCKCEYSKCRFGNCQYYDVYIYNNKTRVACLIKDELIKNLTKEERDTCTTFKQCNISKCTD